MADMKTQFKINKLAKDLGLKGKDLVDLLAKHGKEVTAQKALEVAEFDILFDSLTKENQIDNIGAYLDGETYIPSKKKPVKAEKPKAEEKKPAEEAAPTKGEESIPVKTEKPAEKKTLKEMKLGDEFTIVGQPENYLFLDFIRYSTDGVNYAKPLHHMALFNRLLKERYEGKLYLKYEFDVDEVPKLCNLLAEDTNTISVTVNGETVERNGSSPLEKALWKYDVASKLKVGHNEIVILINYFQSETVYYALFGENVTESLKNCLAYDTDIEAIALKGSFGVYGDFAKGKEENIVIGENFRIGKQKQTITRLIEEGYPFFSGDITLKQTVTVKDTNCALVFDKRFQLLEVKVNGMYAGKVMFDNKIDISNFLKKGENEIELVLTVGNRNLLGPFHLPDQESFSVGPYSYERMGSWDEEGNSALFVKPYAFVKTIL